MGLLRGTKRNLPPHHVSPTTNRRRVCQRALVGGRRKPTRGDACPGHRDGGRPDSGGMMRKTDQTTWNLRFREMSWGTGCAMMRWFPARGMFCGGQPGHLDDWGFSRLVGDDWEDDF